jgi:hypothetical protein
MEYEFTIIAAGGTTNPCRFILDKKGYKLFIQEGDDIARYHIAVKGERRFVGHSAPEVLGLVTMWEEMGDDWHDKLSGLPDIIPEEIAPDE